MTSLTRRDFLKWVGGSVASAAILTSCNPTPTSARIPTTMPSPTIQTPTGESLDFKIGQMLLVGFRGMEAKNDLPIIHDLRERFLGGVVLFDYDGVTREYVRNVQSPAQVKSLVTGLKQAATNSLLVAVDQEGGYVARLRERWGFPATLSAASLGKANDLALTHAKASEMAKTLAEVGINLNLAPVVDVNTNPNNPIIAKYERSFSPDPKIVTQHALEFIKAHHEQNVLTTLKHFPGHGSSTGDTHSGVVDVTKTWSRIELEPYASIIQANQADAVMTAHVFNANIDSNYPATLSSATITGILRGELKYDGVVISDDMQMGAITSQFGFETAILKSIQAGVDIIAIANNMTYDENVVAKTIALVKQFVQAGTLTEARIDQSYQRIKKLKDKV